MVLQTNEKPGSHSFRSLDYNESSVTSNSPSLRYVLCIYGMAGNTGDIILYDGRLAVYKHSLDLIFYLIANQDENELMINAALSAFSDAIHMLLRNQVEKRAVLENLDLVLLCLDETIDEGCVTFGSSPRRTLHWCPDILLLWANIDLFAPPS